jgi:hypothetical protein
MRWLDAKKPVETGFFVILLMLKQLRASILR